MAQMRAEYATLKATRWGGWAGYDAWFARANNATLGVLAAYNELVPDFERLFDRSGGDFERFYADGAGAWPPCPRPSAAPNSRRHPEEDRQHGRHPDPSRAPSRPGQGAQDRLGLGRAGRAAISAWPARVLQGETSDTVEFTRTGVSGRLIVAADHFDLEARLGFLLGAFSRTIEAEITKNLDALLARGEGAGGKGKARKAGR